MFITIDLKRQVSVQVALFFIFWGVHHTLALTRVGVYTKKDPRWYDTLALSIQTTTTTGMSECLPANAISVIAATCHTILAFVLIATY
jgi:hypothetical protein